MPGKLVIFSGPSGVGKDTLLDAWMKSNPNVRRVVTTTTRAPREGEVDGRDYNFVTLREFGQLVAEGAFLEHKEVHGNFYASPLRETERLLAQGFIAVLKIDVQGALQVMPLRPDATTIFILPPSMDELERRIRGRGTDSAEVIATRLRNALGEVAAARAYKHRVVNDDIGHAVAELNAILEKETQPCANS